MWLFSNREVTVQIVCLPCLSCEEELDLQHGIIVSEIELPSSHLQQDREPNLNQDKFQTN